MTVMTQPELNLK